MSLKRAFTTGVCSFVLGDTIGVNKRISELPVGAVDNPMQCADIVRQKCPGANGILFYRSVLTGCYAVYNATEIIAKGGSDPRDILISCLFHGQLPSFLCQVTISQLKS